MERTWLSQQESALSAEKSSSSSRTNPVSPTTARIAAPLNRLPQRLSATWTLRNARLQVKPTKLAGKRCATSSTARIVRIAIQSMPPSENHLAACYRNISDTLIYPDRPILKECNRPDFVNLTWNKRKLDVKSIVVKSTIVWTHFVPRVRSLPTAVTAMRRACHRDE
jgi:hypothetical protein